MFWELLDVVTDLVPSGLAAHKLMKMIANDWVIIKTIRCDGEGIFLRLDFTQGRAALLAEAACVNTRFVT